MVSRGQRGALNDKYVFVKKGGRKTHGNQNPKCALIPADGGIWEITAIQRIKTWLTEQLKETGVTIIA